MVKVIQRYDKNPQSALDDMEYIKYCGGLREAEYFATKSWFIKKYKGYLKEYDGKKGKEGLADGDKVASTDTQQAQSVA